MDNYTMNVNKLLKSVLPGINEGYGHETPDNVSADQNRAIDALAQLGYTFNSWSASSNPEHEGKSMAAAMMSKKDRSTTMYAEIEPDGSINGVPLDKWIEKYFVKNSNEEAAEDKLDPELKKIGFDKETIGAVSVAQKLATQPGRFNLPIFGSQAKMNKAYGRMMDKIATRINTMSSKI
jgi:hypothetical protein